MHEAAVHSASCFTTLTYRDADLPVDGGLDKEEVQRFWKRLRKQVEPQKIRYYACGEYGESTFRPHYHVIIFGLEQCSCSKERWKRATLNPGVPCGCRDRDLVLKNWGHGGVDRLGTVTYDSARYCADYIGKAVTGMKAVGFYGLRQAPFQVMSTGLGRKYVDENREQLLETLGVTVHGVPMGLPRYYAHRLEVNWNEIVNDMTRIKQGEKVAASKKRRQWTGAILPGQIIITDSREQRNKDTQARVNISKKGVL
ncbi:MAG: replication initiator protein [Microvirus sp.]|nr:MAG: replication initiator protein [Microvirus sp.]